MPATGGIQVARSAEVIEVVGCRAAADWPRPSPTIDTTTECFLTGIMKQVASSSRAIMTISALATLQNRLGDRLSWCMRTAADVRCRRAPDNAKFVMIKTRASPESGVTASQPDALRGRWIKWRSKFGNQPQNVAEQFQWDGDLRALKRDIATVDQHHRADINLYHARGPAPKGCRTRRCLCRWDTPAPQGVGLLSRELRHPCRRRTQP